MQRTRNVGRGMTIVNVFAITAHFGLKTATDSIVVDGSRRGLEVEAIGNVRCRSSGRRGLVGWFHRFKRKYPGVS